MADFGHERWIVQIHVIVAWVQAVFRGNQPAVEAVFVVEVRGGVRHHARDVANWTRVADHAAEEIGGHLHHEREEVFQEVADDDLVVSLVVSDFLESSLHVVLCSVGLRHFGRFFTTVVEILAERLEGRQIGDGKHVVVTLKRREQLQHLDNALKKNEKINREYFRDFPENH